ncbi:MAG TPA: metallophosphoesterase [Candidatus Baltobacteraceae bacterium]|nr:metallophosphoesterase [Candidatus Baltobacteraceae bacterium]
MKRGSFLEHVGWTGAGIVFTLSSVGTVRASALASPGAFSFVQISDSHIGFNQPANDHVAATLKLAVDRINALPQQPAFVIHTGDVTHLSKAAQFDDAKNILAGLKAPLYTIPGEHDMIGDEGKAYFASLGRKDAKTPWYSFDMNGTHFVALVNVFNFEKNGLLGQDQIDWLKADLAGLKSSTPLVVFGHVPLYALFPQWGWTTEDGPKALALLARFSNVAVLNGHIHQVMEHTEGNVRFYTASATAYPQPAPGTADKPGPLTVPSDHLLGVLGYRTVALGPATPDVEQHALG